MLLSFFPAAGYAVYVLDNTMTYDPLYLGFVSIACFSCKVQQPLPLPAVTGKATSTPPANRVVGALLREWMLLLRILFPVQLCSLWSTLQW